MATKQNFKKEISEIVDNIIIEKQQSLRQEIDKLGDAAQSERNKIENKITALEQTHTQVVHTVKGYSLSKDLRTHAQIAQEVCDVLVRAAAKDTHRDWLPRLIQKVLIAIKTKLGFLDVSPPGFFKKTDTAKQLNKAIKDVEALDTSADAGHKPSASGPTTA